MHAFSPYSRGKSGLFPRIFHLTPLVSNWSGEYLAAGSGRTFVWLAQRRKRKTRKMECADTSRATVYFSFASSSLFASFFLFIRPIVPLFPPPRCFLRLSPSLPPSAPPFFSPLFFVLFLLSVFFFSF